MVIDELKLVSNFQEKPDAAAGVSRRIFHFKARRAGKICNRRMTI